MRAEYDLVLSGLQKYGSEPGSSVWYVINYAEGIKPLRPR